MQGRGIPTLERAERSGKGGAQRGLHKRSAEAWGDALRARGAELLSVLRTCVTKQTGDMRYSEAEPRWFTTPVLRTMMRYALESEFCCGSTFAILIELSKGGDVGYRSLP